MSIRVALADDHRMFREALAGTLAAETDIEIVGQADTGRAGIELAQSARPDILVLDIAMPDMNGIEVAQRLRACCPEVRVLALSGYADKRFVQEMLRAGAAGYVVKTAAGAELVQAIRAVAKAQHYLSPEITSAVLGDYRNASPSDAPPANVLGRRERQVLALVAQGQRSPAIATRLKISVATVEGHRRNIKRKLGLHTVADLTRYAVREGLVSL
jgi:two-component system NarL family response regulator